MKAAGTTIDNTSSTQVSQKAVYLPGLNGLRAIAALAVVVSHITLGLGDFGLSSKIFGTDANGNPKGLDLASYGVTIFFTLSGFLITYLLLKEKEISSLKIKDFYIRRLLRIWPLYYLYFIIVLITLYSFGISYQQSSLPFYIFLAANVPFILGKTIPLLVHYWSLGVEEQFYLFFPQIARFSNKKLFRIVIFLIGTLLALKILFWILFRKYGVEVPLLAIGVTRFHIMLIGVAGAILYFNSNQKFIAISTHRITQAVSWLCILFVALNRFYVPSIISGEVISIASLCLIMGQVTKKNYLINLENKVCDFIGKISYGIYVIHPLLLFYITKLIGRFQSDSLLNYILVYGLVIAATILVAYVSYEYYEKRFLKLKARFTTVKSSNTRSQAE